MRTLISQADRVNFHDSFCGIDLAQKIISRVFIWVLGWGCSLTLI